ncbi:MAG: hypothetical protein M3Z66_16505, partial [Chloroflexota bacterium]|nr:hypothetical protein [Chloroflexota bacterium]
LTLRAADSTFGILLHTLPDAIPRAPYSDGIVVTGGGVTTDPLNALTQLQNRADDQPTLWEVIEVSVADAAAELAEAMFCTDSYPQVCSDPHYWQSRRLIMMLLDNISEAAEYEQWQYGEDEDETKDSDLY